MTSSGVVATSITRKCSYSGCSSSSTTRSENAGAPYDWIGFGYDFLSSFSLLETTLTVYDGIGEKETWFGNVYDWDCDEDCDALITGGTILMLEGEFFTLEGGRFI